MLLWRLLVLLLSTLVIVVVNVSVVCTVALVVAVIVTGIYPLSTHATTVVIAMENVDMTKRLIIYYDVLCQARSVFALTCGLQLPSREPTTRKRAV